MTETEGIVLTLNPKGMATVLIQAETGGCIPGAPEMNHCHCSGCSSRITIEASNVMGAVTGQRVRVSHRPGAVMKSVGSLLGIPSAGFLLGWAAGAVLFYLFKAGFFLSFLTGGIFPLAGIAAGVHFYRRNTDDNRPIITRIV